MRACISRLATDPVLQRLWWLLVAVDVPLLILGGGCAGLSLATRLAALETSIPRTLVLESRSTYRNDRTWCFWADPSLGVDHLITHEWRQLTVRGAGIEANVDCGVMPYQMLRGDRFYADCRARMAQNSFIELVTNAAVLGEPRREGNRWHVSTRAGVFRAARLIDTRPQNVPKVGHAVLWQSFSGEEVTCEKRVFDPTRAVLMDFDDVSGNGVQFRYVLPTSSNTALIESTVFGCEPLSAVDLAPALGAAVRDQLGSAAYQVLRREHGVLPMGLMRRAEGVHSSFVYAGVVGGAARASTGYAFQRIQRWAARCANSIAIGGPIVGHPPEPVWRSVMDRIFLQVLRAHPERAPQLFAQLFSRACSTRVTRFLSDRGSLADQAAVIVALPTGLFLSCLPRLVSEGFARRRAGLPA
jgi:lycopene beta-cyclase